MNVICPECTTTYRVDPAKVPAEGVLAQCERCPATFRVAAGTSDVELEAASAIADSGSAVRGDDNPENPTDLDSAGASEVAGVAGGVDGHGGAFAESHSPSWPGDDGAGAALEALPDGGGAAPGESGSADDPATGYSGASDVAFHTEGADVEDLPYLKPSERGSFSGLDDRDLPVTPTASMNADQSEEDSSSAPLSGSASERESAVEDPSSPGETPLPPAPFGARSDPHRRAERLARALVSDIVVYHPERRTRSLRQGTLRQEFREEIRKSWEEYANQVGGDFARQTTYFRDALNEILAEGATVF